MTDEAETSSALLRGWWPPSRRGWIVLGILGFLLVVRVALPTIAQRVIESQGSELLTGDVTVENVDLWLLRGAVAIEGVALWPAGGAPKEEEPPAEPALVAWDRVYVNVSWIALAQKIAEVEDFELDGLAVNVARLHDGTLVLPELNELPPEEDPEEEDDTGTPFGILIDRAALLKARILVRDEVPSPPSVRELRLPSVVVTDLAINDEDANEPGQVVVRAALGRGTIRVEAQVSEQAGGFQTDTRIEIDSFPLDQMHVHEPMLGWTSSAGSMNAALHIEVDRDARVRASGRAAISDLAIGVPDEDEPGLAWRQLELEVDQIDVAKQTAKLARISLDGARVLVRPEVEPPLPIIPAALVSPTDASPAATARADEPAADAGEPNSAPTTQAPEADAPTPEPTAGAAEPSPEPTTEAPEAAVPTPEPTAGAAEPSPEPTTEAPEADMPAPEPTAGAAEGDEPTNAPPASDDSSSAANEAEPPSQGPIDEPQGEPTDDVEEGSEAPPDWAVQLALLEVTDAAANLVFEGQPARATLGGLRVTEIDAAGTTWKIGAIEVTDSGAEAIINGQAARANVGTLTIAPLEGQDASFALGPVKIGATVAEAELRTGDAKVEVPTLTATGVTSDPAKPIHVVGTIREAESVIELDATVVQQAQSVQATIDLENVLLGRYADLSGMSPVQMPTGLLQAALALEVKEGNAHLAGQLAIDELQILTQDGENDFSVAWDALALDIRTLDLNLENPDEPMNLELAELRIETPNIRGTLTKEGIVLPTVRQTDAPEPSDATGGEITDEPATAEAESTEKPKTAEAESTTQATTADAESTKKPTTADAESTKKPATGDAQSTKKPATDDAESTKKPATDDAESTKKPATDDAESTKKPTTDDAEPQETQTAEADAGTDADAPPSPDHDVVIRQGLSVQTESVGVEEIAEFAEPAANLPLGFVIDRILITDGTFRIVDRAVRPTYRGKITDLQFDMTGLSLAHDAAPTDAEFERMSLDLLAPGEAPVKIRAETETKGIRVDANVEKLRLAQFNPYVQQASGYTVLEGAATVESSVLWAKERYESDTDVTLRSLDVGDEEGGTLFKDTFGISIGAALALMADVAGNIGLGIPVAGSLRDGAAVGVGSIVGQAITKAILGAITSPLKIIGAFTMSDGKVVDVQPKPLPFRPGTTNITESAAEQAEQIGDVLASTPAIKLELIGEAGPDDVRGLREQAVLAELRGESGFVSGLRSLVGAGRQAIRDALESDDVGSLSEEDQATLDELAAEHEVTDDDLLELARERAEALHEKLVEGHGAREDQISIGEPRVSREEGSPQVAVNLLAHA